VDWSLKSGYIIEGKRWNEGGPGLRGTPSPQRYHYSASNEVVKKGKIIPKAHEVGSH